jgi:phage-related minor tail protein
MADEVVEVVIKATDEASGIFDNIGSSVQGLGTAALGVAAGGLAILGAGLVALGTAAFNAGLTVDDAMDTIVVATGATGEELAALEESFATVFSSVPTDAGLAAEVIGTLNTRVDATGPALEDMAANLLEATRLLGGDAVTNTELFTRVLGDWGVGVEDGADLLDTFFIASQNSGAGLDSLMQQVVAFGSPLRLMGFDLETSIALFAKWEQEGVNAELVMGSLRIAAGQFANANIPLQEGLQNTMEAIMGAADESEALAIAMDVFGARAGPDMAAAILEGRFAIEDLLAVMQDSEGAIMETAAQTADFGEMWTVVKNQITLAIEPIGAAMMGLVNNIMPLVQGAFAWFETNLVPIMIEVTNVFAAFFEGIISGEDPIGDLANLVFELATIFGVSRDRAVELFNSVITLRDTIPALIANVQAAIAPILDLVGEFVKWQDVLAALGIAIAIVIIPAIASLVASLAPVILAALAIVAAIAWVRTGWENDWLGLATFYTDLWEGMIRPALEQLWQWLQINVPAALETLKNYWLTVLLPAVQNVWGWLTNTLFPTLNTLWIWLKDTITAALTNLGNFWRNVLLPAINEVWSFIQANIFPLFNALTNVYIAALKLELGLLKTFWDQVLLPAIQAVWQFIQDNIVPIFRDLIDLWIFGLKTELAILADFWEETLLPALQVVWGFLQDNIGPVLDSIIGRIGAFSDQIGGVVGAIQTLIGWLEDLATAIGNVNLPSFSTPGGNGFGGNNFTGDGGGAGFGGGFGGLGSGGGGTTINNFYQTNNNYGTYTTAKEDFDLMRSLVGG